jgi:hypothetical protein
VELTSGLPLTISIAAGLIESSGGEITRELVDVMKSDHLRAASSEEEDSSTMVSVEDRLINTSLAMFKDNNKHLINICFMSFAAFPEDTSIPGQVFDIIAEHLVNIAKQQQQHQQHVGEENIEKVSITASDSSNFGTSLDGNFRGSSSHMLQVRSAMTALVKANLCSGAYADSLGFTVHDVSAFFLFLFSFLFFAFKLNKHIHTHITTPISHTQPPNLHIKYIMGFFFFFL